MIKLVELNRPNITVKLNFLLSLTEFGFVCICLCNEFQQLDVYKAMQPWETTHRVIEILKQILQSYRESKGKFNLADCLYCTVLVHKIDQDVNKLKQLKQ